MEAIRPTLSEDEQRELTVYNAMLGQLSARSAECNERSLHDASRCKARAETKVLDDRLVLLESSSLS